MVEFGNTLKTLRLQNNFTQAQLAQRLGVTKSVISAYETGLRMPSYDVLISISQIFKVTTDYLLGLEKKQGLDLSGLTEDEVQALTELIKAMKRRSGDFGK
ncbi:helix-turn-helix domain-containing protein [Muricomes sp. OA1]|uniref:XRE family transcriptional regulator n=1 Tax=Hungatella hathewayi TaxID=154046 RepID=A0A3E2WIJ5_9FIRM|nr:MULTISPECIES: helix-turn-helix transcriptional regulator [Clostridia]MCH1971989.1 helix-turn-helix domain-containing protein [Muricomes sp. OA1]MRM89530.1 XRE family transcriptional regulator [Faecalicatena contorta]RGC26134.1 XRE family transcriptional regulator [Hungatella hathewayi]GKH30791.1 transcriptional regulator [Faecalicatena contorta]